jgi:hypothetical protein
MSRAARRLRLLVATLATLPSTSLTHQLRSRGDSGQMHRAELEHLRARVRVTRIPD